MKLSPLKVLSDPEIQQIHEATLNILEHCGVEILNPHMLASLKERGLNVDADKRIVRFPRAVVEDALAQAPPQFEVFNREGKPLYTLGDGNSRIAAGHNAVFWLDSDTGETRGSTVRDVEIFARICHDLEAIDMIGIPVMPQDVPDPKATLLYGVRACIENSTKPIYFSTDNAKVNRACIELLRAAYEGDFDNQVYGISQLSSTAPLYWEDHVLEAIVDTVTTGVPLAILPEPIAGLSAPYTLAGLITVCNAECLSGLVMIQLLRPGHKFLYANSWTTMDMQSGAALVGSTETTLYRIAGAQLARFYKLPCHTTAPNSDNHAHDEQNAWEKTFSAFCSVAAGNDLVVNCGMFATGMTCSHEQLIMDEEISAMSKRIATGLQVDPATIATDLIKEIGPRGKNYMLSPHTMAWLRSREYLPPRVSVRGSRALWETRGAKDTARLANEAARPYFNAPSAAPLAPARQTAMDEIVSDFQN